MNTRPTAIETRTARARMIYTVPFAIILISGPLAQNPGRRALSANHSSTGRRSIRWASTGSSATIRAAPRPFNSSTARRARQPGGGAFPCSGSSAEAHLREKLVSRIDVPADGWLFAGSALLLDPATAYELKLTLVDSQARMTANCGATGSTRVLRGQTRASREFPPDAAPPRRSRLGRRPRHRGRPVSRPGSRSFRLGPRRPFLAAQRRLRRCLGCQSQWHTR